MDSSFLWILVFALTLPRRGQCLVEFVCENGELDLECNDGEAVKLIDAKIGHCDKPKHKDCCRARDFTNLGLYSDLISHVKYRQWPVDFQISHIGRGQINSAMLNYECIDLADGTDMCEKQKTWTRFLYHYADGLRSCKCEVWPKDARVTSRAELTDSTLRLNEERKQEWELQGSRTMTEDMFFELDTDGHTDFVFFYFNKTVKVECKEPIEGSGPPEDLTTDYINPEATSDAYIVTTQSTRQPDSTEKGVQTSNPDKLSAGAIAGIAIGSAVLLVLLIILIFMCLRRKKTPVETNRFGNIEKALRNKDVTSHPVNNDGYDYIDHGDTYTYMDTDGLDRSARIGVKSSLKNGETPTAPPLPARPEHSDDDTATVYAYMSDEYNISQPSDVTTRDTRPANAIKAGPNYVDYEDVSNRQNSDYAEYESQSNDKQADEETGEKGDKQIVKHTAEQTLQQNKSEKL